MLFFYFKEILFTLFVGLTINAIAVGGSLESCNFKKLIHKT
jgi:hypothetical protein